MPSVTARNARARVYLDCDMEEPEVFAVEAAQVAVFSRRAPGRSGNQDGAAVVAVGGEGAVLAVADGLGGGRAGEQASTLAIQCLVDAVERQPQGEVPLRTAILDAFEVANEAVLGLGIGAATTLAVAELRGGALRPYHVGDSSILVFGQRGRVKLQTVAHSPVGFAVEAGLLDAQEAMHHEERHVVSNVLGASDMRIEIGSEIRLAPRDTVLLASDGLLDNLHGDEIVELARKGALTRAASRLAEDAALRMREPVPGQPSKPDDLTFVAWRPGPGGA